MTAIIYSVLVAFLISLLLGPIAIPLLHKLKFGQNIEKRVPKAIKKAGTPTMGGLIFIITAIVTMIIMRGSVMSNKNVIFVFICFIAFGIIGFLDDYLKIVHKKNEGLTVKQKSFLQCIFSCGLAYYASVNIGTDIYVPILKTTWQIGTVGYIILIIIYFVATTNAVNLTDGLDGLATSVTLLVMTFFGMVSFAWHNYELAVLCGIIAGALLGFLRYNAYPAQIFMGDTGSLALGGIVAGTALVLKLPLLVIIVGGIYLMEALSVIIQVVVFKKTKKRFFKMAPIHHHFEQIGWHETKVVAVFSISTVVLCLIAFLLL